MQVQDRCASRRNQCFGKALIANTMLAWMQQLPDFRIILGDVRKDFASAGYFCHLPGQGWMGTVEIELAGAPSIILRLIAIYTSTFRFLSRKR